MTKTQSQPFYFQVVLIGGAVFIALMLFALARSIYGDLFQVGRYIDTSMTAIEDRRQNLANQPAELAYANTPQFQEKLAKELLGRKSSGEKVIILTTGQQEFADFLPKNVSHTRELLTAPQKWWRFVFG